MALYFTRLACTCIVAFIIYYYDNIIMGLLDFLVTSETRKGLLRLLWGQNVEASAHQLAKLTDAAYSGVHAELGAMEKEGLVMARRKGKALIFRKNDGYHYASELRGLLADQMRWAGPTQASDDDVRLNLVKFGAPLAVHGETNVDLPVEEALVAGLNLSRRDATVARVLPVVFAKNRNSVDWDRLEFRARQQGVLQPLGLFLDLTGSLLNNNSLKRRAKHFMDHRRKHLEHFFLNAKPNRFEQMLAEANTPKVARDWKYLMNVNMDSFESAFKKNMGELTA